MAVKVKCLSARDVALLVSRHYELNFSKDVDSSLCCCRCRQVAIDRILLRCGHLMCFACVTILSNLTCPQCHAIILQEFDDPRQIKTRILALQVNCPNFIFGCGYKGLLPTIPKHVKKCPFEDSLKVKKIDDNFKVPANLGNADPQGFREIEHNVAQQLRKDKENLIKLEIERPLRSLVPPLSIAFPLIVKNWTACTNYEVDSPFISLPHDNFKVKATFEMPDCLIYLKFYKNDLAAPPPFHYSNIPTVSFIVQNLSKPSGTMLNNFTYYTEVTFRQLLSENVEYTSRYYFTTLDNRLLEKCAKNEQLMIMISIDFPPENLKFTNGSVVWEVENLLLNYTFDDYSTGNFGFSPYFYSKPLGYRLKANIYKPSCLKGIGLDELQNSKVLVKVTILSGKNDKDLLNVTVHLCLKAVLAYRRNSLEPFIVSDTALIVHDETVLELPTVKELTELLKSSGQDIRRLQLKITVEDAAFPILDCSVIESVDYKSEESIPVASEVDIADRTQMPFERLEQSDPDDEKIDLASLVSPSSNVVADPEVPDEWDKEEPEIESVKGEQEIESASASQDSIPKKEELVVPKPTYATVASAGRKQPHSLLTWKKKP
ncbi:hypothetical protein CHUAL_003674 [Chamberlinius hualienensis]